MAAKKKPRLGDILINAGMISDQQLRSALAYQRQWDVQLGEAMLSMGFITEVDLLKVLAKQLQVPAVNLAKTYISPETLKFMKREIAEKYTIIPLAKRIDKGQETLLVATHDPTNLALLDEIRFLVNIPIKFVITTRSSILKAIRKFYYNEKVNFSEGIDTRIAKIKEMKSNDLVLKEDDLKKEEQRAQTEQFSKDKGRFSAEKPAVSKEFQALLKLLIRKGLITRNEFIRELKKL